MKKYLFLITAAVIFFTACNDPIFYDISLEEKILEPMIIGSPTNFVEFGGKMYVASGRYIYEYAADAWFSRGIGGSSFIYSLAVANSQIYALCEEKGSKILKYSSDGVNWDDVSPSVNNIQKIYSTNNILFAGVGSSPAYSILSFNGTWTPLCDTGSNLLNGAAYDGTNYYLSAKTGEHLSDENGVIYTTNSPTATAAPLTGNGSFVGIINANNRVFVIARNGTLYTVNSNSAASAGVSLGNNHLATGALAVWTDGTDTLLLAGRQDNQKPHGYAYGYLEVNITSGNISGVFHEPGAGHPTTLSPGFDDNGPYSKSLGKRAVNHLYQYQTTGGTRTLFASLALDGVWSYRDRGGKWQWNAEERR